MKNKVTHIKIDSYGNTFRKHTLENHLKMIIVNNGGESKLGEKRYV